MDGCLLQGSAAVERHSTNTTIQPRPEWSKSRRPPPDGVCSPHTLTLFLACLGSQELRLSVLCWPVCKVCEPQHRGKHDLLRMLRHARLNHTHAGCTVNRMIGYGHVVCRDQYTRGHLCLQPQRIATPLRSDYYRKNSEVSAMPSDHRLGPSPDFGASSTRPGERGGSEGGQRATKGGLLFPLHPTVMVAISCPCLAPGSPGFADSDGPQVLGRQADKFRVCIFKSRISSGWAFLTRNRESLSDPRLGRVRRICAIRKKCYKLRWQYSSACRRVCKCPSNHSIRTTIPPGDT
jgi:hypothetical protein